MRVPFHRPSITQAEIDAVTESIRSGWLTSGPRVKKFEEMFAEQVGVEHAVALNSGTAALHLALDAVGLQRDEFVITSVNTFTATAEVVHYFGATPLFVDIDPHTRNMSPTALEATLQKVTSEGKHVRAILPVHYAGRMCEMDAILSIADKYKLAVVEDSAHAFPASFADRSVGQWGDITCFSFYATKSMTTGEGGMAVTRSNSYAKRMSLMRLHGMNRDAWKRERENDHGQRVTFAHGDDTVDAPNMRSSWYYEIEEAGYKYNMSDPAAAMGIVQLARAEEMRKKRERVAGIYKNELKNLPLELPPEVRKGMVHAWHLYTIALSIPAKERYDGCTRDRVIQKLDESGVGTSVHFIPLHLQPFWQRMHKSNKDDFPVALDLYHRSLSLPLYPDMTDEEIDFVCNTLKNVLKNV